MPATISQSQGQLEMSLEKGFRYRGEMDYAGAVEIFRTISEGAHYRDVGYIELAVTENQMGNVVAGELTLIEGIAEVSDNSNIELFLSNHYLSRGGYEGAITLLESAVENFKAADNEHTNRYLRGYIMDFSSHERPEGLSAEDISKERQLIYDLARIGYERDPRGSRMASMFAEKADEAGDYETALLTLQELVKIPIEKSTDKNRWNLNHLLLAKNRLRYGRASTAIELLSNLPSESPEMENEPMYRHLLGIAHFMKGDYRQAMANFELNHDIMDKERTTDNIAHSQAELRYYARESCVWGALIQVKRLEKAPLCQIHRDLFGQYLLKTREIDPDMGGPYHGLTYKFRNIIGREIEGTGSTQWKADLSRADINLHLNRTSLLEILVNKNKRETR